ncbi:LOW QUALITY PROTEIN: oncostatin-M [Pterocles gutturalis]
MSSGSTGSPGWTGRDSLEELNRRTSPGASQHHFLPPQHLAPLIGPRRPASLLTAFPAGPGASFGGGGEWVLFKKPASPSPSSKEVARAPGSPAPQRPAPAMRHDARPLRLLAAVTKGLLILWAVPSQGGRPLQPPTLQQVQALVRHMAEDAHELFIFYEKDQHLTINHICRTNRPPEWLRGPVPGPGGLRGLRGTMTRMAQALQDIIRHQRDLNPPGAEILRRFASTHLKVRGLLSNLDGLFPAPSPPSGRSPPPGPTAPPRVFQQKLEGCRTLWSYARFMAKLSAQLEPSNRPARREKRRRRGGSRPPARS